MSILRALSPLREIVHGKERLFVPYHLNNFLNQHVNRSFTQYTIPINDKNLFNYIRYKAINYYSKSDSISLIFKNDLNDFWIRIEGETKLMETEKKKIEKDIHFYNQNSFLML